MKRFLVIALLTVSAFFPVLGQTPDSKTEGKAQDEAAIRKLMKDLEVPGTHMMAIPFLTCLPGTPILPIGGVLYDSMGVKRSRK